MLDDALNDHSINRHRTAIKRYRYSRPVATAISHGLISEGTTFFDYGCGHGEDVRLLGEDGVSATGWDPHHSPKTPLHPAEIVNLGYVLNVIEDPRERRQTLAAAFALANSVLVVSVRVDRSVDCGTQCADGVVTKTGTFQKIYSQDEFRDYLQEVLGRKPHMAGLGIAYVFKDGTTETRYLATLSFNRPLGSSHEVIERFDRDAVAQRYLKLFRELARSPLSLEFPELTSLTERFGSLDRIRRIADKLLDPAKLHEAREVKRQNLLTYLAMIALQGLKPPPISALPKEVQADVKTFWSSYTGAIADSKEFLFRLGNPESVRQECRTSAIGKKLPDDLYVHRSVADQLPALLRLLAFAARQIVGDVEHDILKLSMHGRSVSFLRYRDFEDVAHPELEYSVRVFLPRAEYTVRQYSDINPPILHRKESFVDVLHPRYAEFAALSEQEDSLGLLSRSDIGNKQSWLRLLSEHRLKIEGHTIRSVENS